MLRRTYSFLTARSRDEIELAADRLLPALGYARRPDADSGALVFERGRSNAGFYDPSLRALHTRVVCEAEDGALKLHYEVETRGRLQVGDDQKFFELEARTFHRFVEGGDIDVDDFARRSVRLRRATVVKLTVVLAILLAAAAVVAVAAFLKLAK